MTQILLGFEVGSGEPVYLPLHHLAIFGMTQLSGKTTTLEALINRSGLKAVAFITKRGELGFSHANLITPYYKPRSDWQYVEGLVNVALGEKVKYEPGMRYAIMKVSRGRKDLVDVQQATRDAIKNTKKEFMKSVYEKLDAYLDIVIPELKKWVFSTKLELQDGVNVIDISNMRLETQHLVIASTIEHVFTVLDHVIVIIPEAWETIPQGKMTPVKWVAQQFIRKGASIGNYLWLDSQDIGGIDKTPLRQCDNWIMGRMKEAHEVERILKQLLGVKVAAEEIQTLPLGHFYAAIGNLVKKVYVLPFWVPQDVGIQVACGVRSPESVKEEFLKPVIVTEDETLYKQKFENLERNVEEIRREADLNGYSRGRAEAEQDLTVGQVSLKEKVKTLEETTEKMKKELAKTDELIEKLQHTDEEIKDFENFRTALLKILPSPQLIPAYQGEKENLEVSLTDSKTVFHVEETVNHLKVDTGSADGKILWLAREGFLDDWKGQTEIESKMQDQGWTLPRITLYKALSVLEKRGVLGKIEGKPNKYKLARGVKAE